MKTGRLLWVATGISLVLHAAVLGVLPPWYPDHWGEQGADVLSVTLAEAEGHPEADPASEETAALPDARTAKSANTGTAEAERPLRTGAGAVSIPAGQHQKATPAPQSVAIREPVPPETEQRDVQPVQPSPSRPERRLRPVAPQPASQPVDTPDEIPPEAPATVTPLPKRPVSETGSRTAGHRDKAPAAADGVPKGTPGADAPRTPRYRIGQGATPAPPYPYLARRMGWEGRVEVALRVDGQGRPLEAWIVRSSGYPVLDQAALKTLRQWKLAPSPAGEETLTIGIEFRLR